MAGTGSSKDLANQVAILEKPQSSLIEDRRDSKTLQSEIPIGQHFLPEQHVFQPTFQLKHKNYGSA